MFRDFRYFRKIKKNVRTLEVLLQGCLFNNVCKGMSDGCSLKRNMVAVDDKHDSVVFCCARPTLFIFKVTQHNGSNWNTRFVV